MILRDGLRASPLFEQVLGLIDASGLALDAVSREEIALGICHALEMHGERLLACADLPAVAVGRWMCGQCPVEEAAAWARARVAHPALRAHMSWLLRLPRDVIEGYAMIRCGCIRWHDRSPWHPRGAWEIRLGELAPLRAQGFDLALDAAGLRLARLMESLRDGWGEPFGVILSGADPEGDTIPETMRAFFARRRPAVDIPVVCRAPCGGG